MSTTSLEHQVQEARLAASILAGITGQQRKAALLEMAEQLLKHQDTFLRANRLDMEAALAKGTSEAMLDRLKLDEKRLAALANSVRDVAELGDPLGEEIGWVRPNGLVIRRVRVPLGVVAVVYEARPNVTVDAAVLAFKSGNACVLRGSKLAANSNAALVEVLRQALVNKGLPAGAIVGVNDLGHDSVRELATMRGLIDCLIPRGGAGLINSVVSIATVPVIQTGVGNCHLYVHSAADLDMALNILVNGKVSRPAVCNALETLLVDRSVAAKFLPMVQEGLVKPYGVLVHGCPATTELMSLAMPATDNDWGQEYLDLQIAVRVVDGYQAAVEHIREFSSGHSEAIVTRDLPTAQAFQRDIDACAVYVNASTRFTDGGEFGFGAEIGISTQKFHARGPVGLRELTSTKYLVDGQGQVR